MREGRWREVGEKGLVAGGSARARRGRRRERHGGWRRRWWRRLGCAHVLGFGGWGAGDGWAAGMGRGKGARWVGVAGPRGGRAGLRRVGCWAFFLFIISFSPFLFKIAFSFEFKIYHAL
jgi:hypothetical protein